jgi:hypothetical protein
MILTELHQWLTRFSGLPPEKIILENEGGQSIKPSLPYLTYQPFSAVQRVSAQDETFLTNQATNPIEVRALREYTCELNSYGDTGIVQRQAAMQVLNNLSIGISSGEIDLITSTISVIDCSTIRDVGQYMETDFESRFNMELKIYSMEKASIGADLIERVSGEYQVLSDQGIAIEGEFYQEL